MIYGTRLTMFFIAISLSLAVAAIAAELTIPNSFSNGTAANADQVNANFEAVKTAVDDNNQKITALSQPRSASVTYSAMGFSAGKSQTDYYEHETEYEKVGDGGFLLCSEEDGCYFYHSVALRTGVTITKVRAHAFDVVNSNNVFIEVKLQKKVVGENTVVNLASMTSDNSGDQVMEATLEEPIEWSSTNYPPSYFLEVFFSSSSKNILLYSVTIDFTYTAP